MYPSQKSRALAKANATRDGRTIENTVQAWQEKPLDGKITNHGS